MHVYREHHHNQLIAQAWTDSTFDYFSTHWHSLLEIAYVEYGDMQAQVNGQIYHMHDGDILLCGMNDIHSYIRTSGRILLILVSPSLMENPGLFFHDRQLAEHYIPKADLSQEAETLIQKIEKNYSNQEDSLDEFQTLIFHGHVMTLLGYLMSKLKFETSSQTLKLNMYDYMRNIFNYIDEHYCDEDLKLETIANHIGISACYLSRCFKNYSGYTLIEYVNRKRIDRAKKLLQETDKSITDVSLECGYGSIRNFNRVYKNLTGETPHEIRSDRHV